MYFHPLHSPDSSLIGYLLADLDEQEAVIIDPPPRHTELILALLTERSLRLCHVLRTHVHQVDVADCSPLCDRTSAQLVVGEAASMPIGCGQAVHRAAHGSRLVFGNEVIRVLSTPGHTPGCLSYLWRDRLFCGDAFDVGSCGAGDGEADPGMMFDTLTRRLFTLPEQTLVFPAHPIRGRQVATLGELRTRYAARLQQSRDGFITDMIQRRERTPAGKASALPLPRP
jgi:glyoxylase-like metal-dependent hydrolase (beta-lactamase superfamily II)